MQHADDEVAWAQRMTSKTEKRVMIPWWFPFFCVATMALKASAAEECLYVANRGSDTVSVVDTSADTVNGAIAIGNGLRPAGVAVTPDGQYVYLANQLANTVAVLRTGTDTVVATLPVPGPRDVALTPDGRFAYVASPDAQIVSVIDTCTYTVTASVAIRPGPSAVAVSPDGASVYVATVVDTVAVIDTATNAVRATLQVGGNHNGIALTPDGRFVLVTNRQSLSIIDTATRQVAGTIRTPIRDDMTDVAVRGDGRAYVAVSGSPGGVVVVDIARATIVTTIAVPDPQHLALTPDGAFAYVASNGYSTVSVIDLATNKVVSTLPIFAAGDVAITPDGALAYVSTGGGVAIIITGDNTVAASVDGTFPFAIALSSDGRFAYVANDASNTLSVIDLTLPAAVKTIAVGPSPSAVRVSPDGTVAYVLSRPYGEPGGVIAVDVAHGAAHKLPAELVAPAALALTPDGAFAYVVDGSSPGKLLVIDLATGATVSTVPIDAYPGDVVISHDGGRAYVTAGAGASASVVVLDTATQAIISRIMLPSPVRNAHVTEPGRLALTADGARVYIAAPATIFDSPPFGVVYALDTQNGSIDATATVQLDLPPAAVAVTEDGARLYVTSAALRSHALSVIDTATHAVTATLPVGNEPDGLAIGSIPSGCGTQPFPTRVPSPLVSIVVTPRPTSTPTPTPSPTPTVHVVAVNVGSATGTAGAQVGVSVTLQTGGFVVAAVQNDISFLSGILSLVDCQVNATLGKDLTQFKYSPSGLRAIILGNNVDPIPDGSVLYTCTFTINSNPPPGTFSLINARVVASSPSGEVLPVVAGQGEIVIPGARPTPTPTATATPVLPAIAMDFPVASPGDRIPVRAILHTTGATVIATQNDLRVDGTAIHIARTADGAPDCSVNPDIARTAQFTFPPGSCGADGCVALHASVAPGEGALAINDGSVLYTCHIEVSSDAAAGDYPLVVGGVVLIDPSGQPLPQASGSYGTVFVRPPLPTPTPIAPAVRIDTVYANAGDLVQVGVRLEASGAQVAGAQNDIGFDGTNVWVTAKPNGRPACSVNPEIDKTATAFAFRPPGCAGAACTSVRAIVVSTENADAIPDGAVLYTCTLQIGAAATAFYELTADNVVLSTPQGAQIPGATGYSGYVDAGPHDGHGPPVNGPPPAVTATSTAGAPTATRTRGPTATATSASPPPLNAGGGVPAEAGDSGGCQASRPARGQLPILLVAAAWLLAHTTRRVRRDTGKRGARYAPRRRSADDQR